jgi:hypothetical protein
VLAALASSHATGSLLYECCMTDAVLHVHTSLAAVTSLWPARSTRCRWSSHELLQLTRGLGRRRLAGLLRCVLLRIVGLLALET